MFPFLLYILLIQLHTVTISADTVLKHTIAIARCLDWNVQAVRSLSSALIFSGLHTLIRNQVTSRALNGLQDTRSKYIACCFSKQCIAILLVSIIYSKLSPVWQGLLGSVTCVMSGLPTYFILAMLIAVLEIACNACRDFKILGSHSDKSTVKWYILYIYQQYNTS